MKKDFLIIGFFGYITNQIDGQTVRSRNIKKLLTQEFGFNTSYYDTQAFRKNPLGIFSLLFSIPLHKKVVILPAHRNVKFLMPVIVLYSKLWFKKVYFVAIGGWLAGLVQKNTYLKFFLKRLNHLFVQTNDLKEKLEAMGIANVTILPNFKFHDFERPLPVVSNDLKVIFMSRVMREKGLDTLENLARRIEADNVPVTIDIYGPMAKADEGYLHEIVKNYSSLQYLGLVQPDDVHPVMGKYDVFLFPTHYMTEGFPGVILDAFIAGIPVVASKWNYATEFIDETNGLLFNHQEWEQAYAHITQLLNNKPLLEKLKQGSYLSREKYAVPAIKKILEKAGMV
ncbi:glycosyltransferase family 4 protein [Mucilaginibacter phyllosphaerae]|uniref:Glycosyltransferase n=1 Tax=Mucilaginibacter phyllosphaerae TaxID=1812349 RepID=A0A4Y8AHW4_9SPHI|nr:glycosyltransferase family 4 protein [Mucilaginibacter phyllosphaerae]MBB3968627.1 glycosyltransferase involved in cell wall biosynthesis [Mucilaginibacter phyllosphaerae]TEW67735.1 glycosyltransferase [Mucilaginibacter phyllosphaerae]GGH14842.1 hypothetical protein GCM10007352_23220 [Mucilaginibacter phyllosphaerae]